MKILHLSHTPLVGAPGRICRALNLHDGVQARWVVSRPEVGVYDKMIFDLDLRWDRDRDEVLAFAEQCDVLHLHNFLDLDSQEFAPLDLRKCWAQGRAIVRHFHSTTDHVARFMKLPERAIIDCPIPKLVIAQYPERFFRRARLVPNFVGYTPSDAEGPPIRDGRIRIGFAPSRFNAARSSRWDTKGYPETIKMLKSVARAVRARGSKVEIDVIENVSHQECMQRKSLCHIVIDDLVTGSYHLNTLESLAQGSACLSFLDRRTQAAVAQLPAPNHFPALGVGLQQAVAGLPYLAGHAPTTLALGQGSRQWMQRHWQAFDMAGHFLDAYAAVLRSPHEAFAARFADDAEAQWRNVGLHDALWRARSAHWPAVTPHWQLRIKGAAGALLRRMGLR